MATVLSFNSTRRELDAPGCDCLRLWVDDDGVLEILVCVAVDGEGPIDYLVAVAVDAKVR